MMECGLESHVWTLPPAGSLLDSHSHMADLHSNVFSTQDGQCWDMCLSPLVVWEPGCGQIEDAVTGRQWTKNGVASDADLSDENRFVGIWLRNRERHSVEISDLFTKRPNRPRYVISLRTLHGKTIATNQDIWLPQVYVNEMRGCFWFCTHQSIRNAVQHLPPNEPSLQVTVEFQHRNHAGLAAPFPLKIDVSEPRDVKLQIRRSIVFVHGRMLSVSSVLMKKLANFDAEFGKGVGRARGSKIQLDDLAPNCDQPSKLLRNFVRILYQPCEASIASLPPAELASLVDLLDQLKLVMLVDIGLSVISRRCATLRDVMDFETALLRCVSWRPMFWRKVWLFANMNETWLSGGALSDPRLQRDLIVKATRDQPRSVSDFLSRRPLLQAKLRRAQTPTAALLELEEPRPLITALADQIYRDLTILWAGNIAKPSAPLLGRSIPGSRHSSVHCVAAA